MRSEICLFEDEQGSVGFLASDIRRIYRIEGAGQNDNELTVIELTPLSPGNSGDSFNVKTQVDAAIEEWKRGLAVFRSVVLAPQPDCEVE